MIYLILIFVLLSIIYSRIFLQKHRLNWLFSLGSAIVVLCLNSVKESFLLEWEQNGYTKNFGLLFFAILIITIQFFYSRKSGLRFFNALLAFIIFKLAPFLSPELQKILL